MLSPTSDERNLVIRLVRLGLSNQIVANTIDISVAQLKRTYPTELLEATHASANVASALYDAAMAGSVPAMKLWLECRSGWIAKNEGQEVATLAQPLMLKLADVPPPPESETKH